MKDVTPSNGVLGELVGEFGSVRLSVDEFSATRLRIDATISDADERAVFIDTT
jgi:hypothetical protein